MPSYIRDQLHSLDGRNGRGRLWIAPELGDPFPDGIPAPQAPRECGGIVLRNEDVRHVEKLPGFLVAPFWPRS